MIFKGRRYTKCPTIVMMPNRDSEGKLLPHVKGDTENYAYFGRVVHQGVVGAVKTDYTFRGTEEHVYALAIQNTGHSRTDLMYGADGYMYLAYNGACYRAKVAKGLAA